MPVFSVASSDKLKTCAEPLQRLFNAVVSERDCVILCGFRGQVDQDAAFDKGFSKLRWPHGRHNKTPSMAVDVIPYPFKNEDWHNTALWAEFVEVVKNKAAELGIPIICGADWTSFPDIDHFELADAPIAEKIA